MKYEMWKDVFWYLNLLTAGLALFILHRNMPKKNESVESILFENKWKHIFLILAVAGLLYLNLKFGDISIGKMIKARGFMKSLIYYTPELDNLHIVKVEKRYKKLWLLRIESETVVSILGAATIPKLAYHRAFLIGDL